MNARQVRRTWLVGAVTAVLLVLSGGPQASAAGRATPGGFTGYAFDARCAPTQAQMDAWLTTSPFWAAGIYLGGSTMSCRPSGSDPGQPHLDATWVRRQVANGWRLLPLWVGPQASCSSYADRIDPTPADAYAAADARGREEAAAAVAAARSLGIAPGSTLWYDLEGGFDVTDTDCRRSALRFLSGWTLAVRALGFRSGVYSSVSAGIHALDNADKLSPGSYAMPDQVWFAWYNGRADTAIDQKWVRSVSWARDRVHQYADQQAATYGGVRLTIDRNFLTVGGGSQAPAAKRYCGGTKLDLARYPTLRQSAKGAQGSKRSQVKTLQCLLKQHARYRGRLDGRFDRGVTTRVRAFQRRADLPVSGRVTARTWVALLARGNAPLLKVGSAEESVRRAQRALRAAGAGRRPVTGVYDDATAAAVASYQRAVGLPATGVLAGDTWAALARGRR